MRILASLVTLLALAAGVVAADAAQAQPAAQELLSVTGELTYDVRPGEGPVTVTWDVQIRNNDPETVFNSFGVSYFYQSVTLPVLSGASALRATGPGGAPLGATIEDAGDVALAGASISFDRSLVFGDTYAFTLSYELSQVQSDFLLVSPNYVFLPAISLGDSSVRVLTPSGGGWDVSVEDGHECEPAGTQSYACDGSFETTQLAAFVEVIQPGALESNHVTVELGDETIDVTIRYFPGQEEWASRAERITSEALPVLEDLYGFPLDRPETFEIAQSGRRDVFGYEGVFSCSAQMCNIGVSPLAVDHVLLHELSHAWTGLFSDRWLLEGFAEFMAQRAEERLSDVIEPLEVPPFERTIDFQLESWGPATVFLNATEEQRERELSGYAASVEFLEELERIIGLEGLQSAIAGVDGRAHVDSRRFLDLLEDTTGERFDELFRERVFLANSAELLDDRRAARDRFDELQRAVADAGLELPSRIDNLLRSWRFDIAESVMLDAEIALSRLTRARDRVDDSRSVWQRIGLIGADPEADIEAAERAFARGNYEESNERAGSARSAIDDATRDGLVRIAVAIAIVVVVGGGLAALSVFVVRLRRRAA